MTAWTDIPDSMIQQGKPIRATDGRALRDNPAAIAEGADGAPRVRGVALAGVYLGSFRQDGRNPQALLGLDRVGLLVADVITAGVSAGGTVQIALSANGGASYGGWITLYAEPGAGEAHAAGRLHLDLVTGAWRVRLLSSDGSTRTTDGTLTLPPGVNAIRLTKANDYAVTVYDWFVLGARS